MTKGGSVVVGFGDRHRGDDRAGLEVVARLERRMPPGTDVITMDGEPTALLDLVASNDLVLIVDAVRSLDAAGTVYRFDASERQIPNSVFGSSTHAFGIGDTIEMARVLGRLEAHVVVYGIAGADFSAGETLSEPVEAAVGTVASRMLEDLEGPGESKKPDCREESHA